VYALTDYREVDRSIALAACDPTRTMGKSSLSVDALKRLAALTLTAVLFTACGGGAAVDGAKVEDSLRDYLGAINSEQSSFPQSSFPVGAGVPRVRHKACTDQHVKVHKGQVL
jgi:hypothetical protein